MNTGTDNLSFAERLEKFSKFMDDNDYNLSHFLVKTEIRNSRRHEMGRVALEDIPAGTTIAIIGGIIIDKSDSYIALPMGSGLYMHQVNNNRKGTINHSCSPNCIMKELNKLTALTDIKAGEELSIDYGTTVAGNGSIIIDGCKCGSSNCRKTITSHDYMTLPEERLSGLSLAVRKSKL